MTLTMTSFSIILKWVILPSVLLLLIGTAIISLLFDQKNEIPKHHLNAEYSFDTVRITDSSTGEEKLILMVDDSHLISSVTISPDGALIAAGTQEGDIYLWETWIGHKENCFNAGQAVKELSFNRKGTILIALLGDGSRKEYSCCLSR